MTSHCDDLKPHAPDCMKRGHRRLAPGVYVCAEEGHLHIVAPELCRAHGYAPTPENIDRLVEAAREQYKNTPLRVVP